MRITNSHLGLVLALGLLPSMSMTAQDPPRGSITIDRIADVKYHTDQVWSPDSKTVAFLWAAAGKQAIRDGVVW